MRVALDCSSNWRRYSQDESSREYLTEWSVSSQELPEFRRHSPHGLTPRS